MDTHADEDMDKFGESSSPPKSVDASSCHNQRLVREYVREDYEEGDNPELKNGADLWSSLTPELDEVTDEIIEPLSPFCDTNLDNEGGGNTEPKNGADLWSSESPEYDEVTHDFIKLPSVSCNTELISDRLEDDEKEDSLQLRKEISEFDLPDKDEQIVGSLAADGSRLLNIDLNCCSARFYCFTLPEIRTVLQRETPTAVIISGVERLRESAEVHDLIRGKLATSSGWHFSEAERIVSLVKMNDELDDLKANLLPNLSPWKGFAFRKGNTSTTSKVIKKVKKISKLAKQLKRSKKVQGLIAQELCELIKRNYPNDLKDYLEEVVVQVETEQDRPVWFYP